MASERLEDLQQRSVNHAVADRYAEGAQAVQPELCCPVSYDRRYLKVLPDEILERDYGCGDPSQYVHSGETVLDLGSGGGKICYIASQVVGPEGRVLGVDMTPDMLDLARRNAATLDYDNVEFHQGEIENIPLPDSLVDVIISNCVINLSTDKDAVFREAFRVLRPGGRLCVSDIVLKRPLPIEIRENLEGWAGCIAGALVKEDYLDRMRKAGFATIEIRDEKDYSAPVEQGDKIMSITLRALKP